MNKRAGSMRSLQRQWRGGGMGLCLIVCMVLLGKPGTAQETPQAAQIQQLEQQLADIQAQLDSQEEVNETLLAAIAAAEELLQALNREQAKYDHVDGAGNTADPLQKELLSELEARQNTLLQQTRLLEEAASEKVDGSTGQ